MKHHINQRIISWALVLILVASASLVILADASMIQSDKKEYLLGETVKIKLNMDKMENVYVDILTPDSVLKFLNPENLLSYRPNEIGKYRVNVYSEKKLIDSISFSVFRGTDNRKYFWTDRTSYIIGEEVLITFNETLIQPSYDLIVKSDTKKFNYEGVPKTSLRFLPKEFGKYSIILMDDDAVLYETYFTVERFAEESRPAGSKNNFTSGSSFRIRNSQGYIAELPYKIKGQDVSGKGSMNLQAQGKVDISFYPEVAGIKEMAFEELDITDFDLGLENVENIELPLGKAKKAYAIDPSSLDFTKAKVTVEAKGYQLFKCRDWNFTMQQCLGTWEFQKLIKPGELYEIELNATDPGYAETGLASINTDKPIYHPEEQVMLTAVVLDQQGYLVSDADVDIVLTLPNSSFVLLEGKESSRGIYHANYTAYFSGTYTISVHATTETIDSEMLSYFEVMPYYEFDILRKTPVTLDVDDILRSSINIFSYSGLNNFSFTETLPESFDVINSDSDIIAQYNGSKYLTWLFLENNATVNYEAKLPEISPELYELQSYVEYNNSRFDEARPWFLAADPSSTYLITFSDCVGWADSTCCAGTDRGECPSSGNTNYTCTYTDTQSSSYLAVSVNVSVINVMTNENFNMVVALNNQNLGNIGTTGLVCAMSSAPNFTLSNINAYRVGGTNKIDLDPQGSARHIINDDGSNNVMRVRVAYTKRPNITLNYPADSAVIEKGRIPFNFTVRDDDTLKNCSLFGNFGGPYVRNETKLGIINNTNKNINITVKPGTFTWGVQCYDTVNALGYSVNRTLFVTKPIDMFYPDKAAPGMNVVVTILGEDFNYSDVIRTSSSDIIVGKYVVINQTGQNTRKAANVIQVPFFIKSDAAAQNLTLNISRAIPPWRFEIVQPVSGSGDYTGQSGAKTLGTGGTNGKRSFFGTIVLQKLIVPSGVTLTVTTADPDGNTSNGDQGYFPAIILVNGTVNISGVFNVNGQNGGSTTTDVGANGGNGGPGGAGGGGGGADDGLGGNGGNGFTGGGSGGADIDGTRTGGRSGNGTGSLGTIGTTVNADGSVGGYSFIGSPAGGGGGLGNANYGAGGAGGTGFIYGTSGTGGGAGSAGAGGYGGAGGGTGGNDNEGGGAGFGSDGTNGAGSSAGLMHLNYMVAPLTGGSGGGGGGSASNGGANDGSGAGGGGGGAVLIYSKKHIYVNNMINATGGKGGDCNDESECGKGGGGSGGAIILQSPYVTISGSLDANGGFGNRGAGGDGQGGDGGDGRIRVDGFSSTTGFSGLLSGFGGSNFTGPSIKNISITQVNGTAYPNSNLTIIIKNANGQTVYYAVNANASGKYSAAVDFYENKNYISVIQNTTNNLYSALSSAAMATYTKGSIPVINSVECEIDLAGNWQACTNLGYGETLRQIRADCIVSGTIVKNVSFEFENVPDATTYFYNFTKDNSTGYWVFDNSNFAIQDSGDMRLTTVCTANNTISTESEISWEVPWGTLSCTVIRPTGPKDVAQNSTFNYTSTLTCNGGECGNINATLGMNYDWWNHTYDYRKRINISHTYSNVTEYQIRTTLDTRSLISSSKMQSTCSDIRAVDSNKNEIPFYVDEAGGLRCNTTETLIWIKVPKLAANETNYVYLYYGNDLVSSKSDIHEVFSYSEPKEIYYLVSELTDTALAMISYENNNNITSNFNQENVVIDEGERTINFIATDVSVGYSFNVTGAVLTAATTAGTADVLSPVSYAGRLFVDYIERGGTGKQWLVYSPFANATVQFYSASTGAASFTLLATRNVGYRAWVSVTNADGTDGHTFRINSTAPVLLAFEQGTADVSILHPAENDLWGVDGGDFSSAHASNNYNLYLSDAATTTGTLQMTDQLRTAEVSQGAGSAIHFNSTYPMGGSEFGDGDGGDKYQFLPEYELEKQYYLPVDGDYIAGAATGPVSCTVISPEGKRPLNFTQNQTYPRPSKICFGNACETQGTNLAAFWTTYANMTCNIPSFIYYDDADQDQTNVYGRKSARQYVWPEPALIVGTEEEYEPNVSMSSSALPFWTHSDNPVDDYDNLCLRNMGSGDSCPITWIVNASGDINTTRSFFAYYNPYVYSEYINTFYCSYVNATIVDIVRPQISSIECHKNGASWVDCSQLSFNDNIAGVRATCEYDGDDPILNVSFRITNLHDNETYFDLATSTNSSGVWTRTLVGETLSDSGDFSIYVRCNVNSNIWGAEEEFWFTPWGNISASWYNPNADVNVTRFDFSNYTINATCRYGECHNLTLILDPIPTPFEFAFMNFETPTDFVQVSGTCGVTAPYLCSGTTPWDDFNMCEDPNGYGMCASTDTNSGSSGAYGFECVGCDRNDAGNDGGLYIYINGSACGGFTCESINISYYQSAFSLDNGNEGSAVWVNDSDGTLRLLSNCMNGEACEAAAQATMGNSAEFVSLDICTVTGIDCSEGVSILFSSFTTVNHATGDIFGWDEINVTGYITKGVIPMNSGTPFYTSTQNPMPWTTWSCLENMTHGDSCLVTWEVNATGVIGGIHEFFVIANATKSTNNETVSNIIDVRIIANAAPVAQSVTLTPAGPTDDDDLYCNFTVTDANYFDTLTANISWYRNSAFYSSSIVSVSSGVMSSFVLGDGNTSLGETWRCGVRPYDQKIYGAQINSSTVTVLVSDPPVISNIQCFEGSWGSCSNILFGDTLVSVRAQCTDLDGFVKNVTFNFTNIPDRRMFFSNTTEDNSTGYYVFNNNDITIRDSGYFNLTVECIDDTNVSAVENVDWLVPWGNLTAVLDNPTTDINMVKHQIGEFRANISCVGGECGNISAILDPMGSYEIAYMTFESPTDFPLQTGDCNTAGTQNCAASSPWDDYEYCEAPNGGYGICASTNMDVRGARGLMCSGCDRNDAGNNGGLQIYINMTKACNGYTCTTINLSYFQAGADLDNSNEGSAVWVNDSDGTLRLVSSCMDTDPCEAGSTATMANVAQRVNVDLCQITGIDCTEDLTLLFSAFTTVAHGTGDYFAWDQINITGHGQKGIIPVGSGIPFYAKSANPKYPTDWNCLFNMTSGDSCTVNWLVNATGVVNSTHELFIYFNATQYEPYYSTEETAHIFVTIVENTVPNVSSVSISPDYPLNATNLICNFTVHDENYFDNLTVNVTWYRNDSRINITRVIVQSDVAKQVNLSHLLTNVGDYYHCGVTPYDYTSWGIQRNSTNVTVLLFPPPALNSIQCMEGDTWKACSNVGYNEILQAVRVNCTSNSGMENATFNLTNVPDRRTYVLNFTSNYVSPFFVINNSDLNITHSGLYMLDVMCKDSAGQVVQEKINWTVPWGTLSASLVSPDSDTNVGYEKFFTFTSQVSCIGGECATVNATLDPYTTNQLYEFTSGYSTNKWAYRLDSDNDPPEPTPNSRTALTGGEATQISVEENTRYTATAAGVGDFVSVEIIMDVSQSVADITRLELVFEGQPDQTNDVNIYGWNYGANVWDELASSVIPADTDDTLKAILTSGFSTYINSSNKIRWLVLNTQANTLMRVDYIGMNISFNAYKGTLSTAQGAIPFYTIDPNAMDYTNNSCLFNMTSGDVCTTSWRVNATGPIGSVHEFFVYYNATNNTAYVQPGITSVINITITDDTNVPPSVILSIPVNSTHTNNPFVIFECNATDNSGLQLMSLYADFNGTFMFNDSLILSGTSDTAQFNRTLNDGYYLWNCEAEDVDLNTDWGIINRSVVVDTVDPMISLLWPANNSVLYSMAVDFNFTVYDAYSRWMSCTIYIDTIEIDSDFTVYNSTATSRPQTVSIDTHEYYINCTDRAGNSNVSMTYYFEVSDIPPNVTLITPDETYFNTPNVTLYYTPTDNLGINTSTLILNGMENRSNYGDIPDEVSSFNISNMIEGRYNWTVNVTDNSNLSAIAVPFYFTVDYTRPDIYLVTPSGDISTGNSEVNITFYPVDNLDDVLECNITLNGNVVDPLFSVNNNTLITRNLSGLPDGFNYWNITCIDNAANYNTSQTLIIDVGAAPFVTLDSPADNHWQSAQEVTFYYTPTDNSGLGICRLYINGVFNTTNQTGITNGAQNSFSVDAFEEGNYYWQVNCTDTFGYSYMTSSRNFTIDFTNPNITLLYPEFDSVIFGRNHNFNFTVTDNLDYSLMCNITVDNTVEAVGLIAQNGLATNKTIQILQDGVHYWNVTCSDNAGNYDISETWNYTSYNPPEVTLQLPIDGSLLNYNDVSLKYVPFDESLNHSTLILNGSVNESDYTLVNEEINDFNLTNLPDGTYSWTVNVTDNSGLSTVPTAWTFTIDTTSPVIVMNHPNLATLDWNNITFNFTVSDNIASSVLCNITVNETQEYSGLSVSSGAIQLFYQAFPDGDYNWTVLCWDQANNTNSGFTEFTVEAPPRITLVSPTNNTRTAQQSLFFDYLPEDIYGIENCTFILDGAARQNSTTVTEGSVNTFSQAGISEGLHNWTVQCFDSIDYNSYSPDPILFRVDISGPSISLNYPIAEQTLNINNVTFNYTAYESDDVIIECNITVSDTVQRNGNTSQPSSVDHTIQLNNFADGDHYWNVTCVDDLGNTNTSETRHFVINQPDFFTNNSYVWVSNSNPDLYQTIMLNVNVSNLGGQPGTNVLVNFYDGNPNLGGVFIGNDTANVAINATVRFNTTWMITPGYHTIYFVVDPFDVYDELSETNNNATLNISVLKLNITSPLNNSWFNTPERRFTFNLTDYTLGNINYSIFINGVSNGQNGIAASGISNSTNITFTEGVRRVYLLGEDSLGRQKTSPVITINIDLTAPVPQITTVNQTWYNKSSPNITILITDNMDTVINYTVFVDGVARNESIVSSGVSTQLTLSNLANGTHTLVLEGLDEAGNRANSTPNIIYVDTVDPKISLLYPPLAYNVLNTSVDLNFSVTDNLDTMLMCNITMDSSVILGNINARNNSVNGTSVSGLTEGQHYWNVTCWDGNTVTSINNKNTSETRYFNFYNPSILTLLAPRNNNWTNSPQVIFYYNATDETGIENCSLILNGTIVQTKLPPDVDNGGISNFTISSLAGNYTWAVQCYDSSPVNAYSRTGNRTLHVDIYNPLPYIETANNTWFNTSTPRIFFNMTDNMDYVLNFTFFANGAINRRGNATNGTTRNITLISLSDNLYSLKLEAMDEAYNRQNSTPKNIYVDTTRPTISLRKPENGNRTPQTNIFFNFTATDNLAPYLLCNLTVDNIVRQNFNTQPGEFNTTTISFSAGIHYWNVTCYDIARNKNTSDTFNFTIPLPDLTLSASDIKFNTTQFIEHTNISINATVYNIGDTLAQDANITFYIGNYTQNNKLASFVYNISAGRNITLNTTWKISGTGLIRIFVVLDPPIATNGSIREANETNNVAYNTFEVDSYQVVYGNLTGLKNIRDLGNLTIYAWNITEYNDTLIYAVDYDSNVNWAQLQALSRNTSNGIQFDDFYELDVALGMENNTDSINNTWTFQNSPILTRGYTVYLNSIQDVPIANSTNTTNFRTGMLWDKSDGGTEYAGTQDIVFITTVNLAKQGRLGIYDYELKVPAYLRNYKVPNTNTITLYTELR